MSTRDTAVQDPEGDWVDGRAKRRLWIESWAVRTVLALVAVLAVVIAAVLVNARLNPRPEESGSSASAPKSPPNLMESADHATVVRASENAIRGFMSATSHLERCRWVVGGESVLPKMEDLYARPGVDLPKGCVDLKIEPAAFGGFAMHTAAALDEQRRVFLLNLFPIGQEMKIDWESSVGFSEMPWPDFCETKPRQATRMRVYLQRDPGPAPVIDGVTQAAFRVSSRGSDVVQWGHAAAGSDLARALHMLVPGAGATQPVHIALAYDLGDAAEPVLRITEIVHNFWVDLDRL